MLLIFLKCVNFATLSQERVGFDKKSARTLQEPQDLLGAANKLNSGSRSHKAPPEIIRKPLAITYPDRAMCAAGHVAQTLVLSIGKWKLT